MLPLRISLLVLLLCSWSITRAEWTGVEFELGDIDADWEFADGVHPTKIRSLGFRIEERTIGGLSIGGGIAYQELNISGSTDFRSRDFSSANFEVYLRQEVPVGESVLLGGFLSYGYFGGYENVSDDRADISWSQVDLELSAGFRFSSVRFTPYARFSNVDGRISQDGGSLDYKLEDPYSYGLRFDIFVEETGFVTLRFQNGSQSGGYLSFSRRY